MKRIKITPSDISRFLSFVVPPNENNGCWMWTGTVAKKQTRARFWVDGDTRTAAVISYIIYCGEIPDGMFVCHKCDNPLCVNPAHLFVGTNSDNMIDMVKKGRRKYDGENSPAHKLTNKNVVDIRMLASGGMKQKDIAKIYGVDSTNISYIVNRKTFAGVV